MKKRECSMSKKKMVTPGIGNKTSFLALGIKMTVEIHVVKDACRHCYFADDAGVC